MFVVAVSLELTWLWFVLGVALAIIEGVTLGIVSIWFAIGAFAALGVSFITGNFYIQFAVFLIVSLILVCFTRKIAVEQFKIGTQKTNVDALVGEQSLVTKSIKSFEPGEVKINGVMWRAKSESDTVYQVGDVVEVLRVEGVTIILK